MSQSVRDSNHICGNGEARSLSRRLRLWIFAGSLFSIPTLNGQTGLFTSALYGVSPIIGQTSFDGTSEQVVVPLPGNVFTPGGVLTTDGNHLYCAGYTEIRRIHLATRESQTLATFEPGQFNPRAITTDGHHFFIAKQGSILEYAMDGSSNRTLAYASSLLTGLITDGIHLYWTDEELGIFRMKLDGSAKEQLVVERDVFGLSLTGTHVYWVNSRQESVRRCALNGSAPEILVNLPAVFGAGVNYLVSGVTATDTHLYWAELGVYKGLYRCELDGSNAVRLTFFDHAGGASLVAYPNAMFPEPMAPVSASISISPSPRTVHLIWPSIPNRRYRILKSTNLIDFNPQHESIGVTTAQGLASFESLEPKAFFRIEKLPGKNLP